MTRSDLVEELAARFAQLTHRDAELAVKTVLDAMSDALVRGHRIEIRGFWQLLDQPPPSSHWPQSALGRKRSNSRKTGPPHFKPGKALREAVDAGTAAAKAKAQA